MPVYEYQCEQCKEKTERLEYIYSERLKTCPKCGGEVKQLFFPFALFWGKVPHSMHLKYSVNKSTDPKKP
jgi:putative FmdB family regulatory protein